MIQIDEIRNKISMYQLNIYQIAKYYIEETIQQNNTEILWTLMWNLAASTNVYHQHILKWS